MALRYHHPHITLGQPALLFDHCFPALSHPNPGNPPMTTAAIARDTAWILKTLRPPGCRPSECRPVWEKSLGRGEVGQSEKLGIAELDHQACGSGDEQRVSLPEERDSLRYHLRCSSRKNVAYTMIAFFQTGNTANDIHPISRISSTSQAGRAGWSAV